MHGDVCISAGRYANAYLTFITHVKGFLLLATGCVQASHNIEIHKTLGLLGACLIIAITHPLLGEEEKEAVRHILASSWLAQGACAAGCEQRFGGVCQTRGDVAVSRVLDAFNLARAAGGIGPGYEAIAADSSFAASAITISLVGSTPVCVEIEPDTDTLDLSLLKTALSQHKDDCALRTPVELPARYAALKRESWHYVPAYLNQIVFRS